MFHNAQGLTQNEQYQIIKYSLVVVAFVKGLLWLSLASPVVDPDHFKHHARFYPVYVHVLLVGK